MMRFAPLATLALVAAVLAPVPAPAQTVQDYEAAVAAVPAAPPTAVVQACLPLQNYVATSLAPGEESAPWLLSVIPFVSWGNDPGIAAKRQDCETVRQQPVIAFNQGSAEEIVTPPMLESEDTLVGPADATTSEPLPGYDTPSRTTKPRSR